MKSFPLLALLIAAPFLQAKEKKAPAEQATVTVGGQVRAPGPVRHTDKLTLYTAIQAARGATEFGSMKRVKLLRDGKPEIYDATDDTEMQTPLKPGDVVIVPQKTLFGK